MKVDDSSFRQLFLTRLHEAYIAEVNRIIEDCFSAHFSAKNPESLAIAHQKLDELNQLCVQLWAVHGPL